MKPHRFSSAQSRVSASVRERHHSTVPGSVLVVVALAGVLAVPLPSQAQTLSLGQAANYAAFEVNGLGGTLGLTGTSGSPTTINGSVALGANTNLNVGSYSTISGTAYYDTGVNLHGYGGTTASANLSAAGSAVSTAISTISHLAATSGMPTGSLNAGGSLTGAGGVTLNVIDLTGAVNITNGTFTINGSANQWFVFDVAGAMILNKGTIALAGGVTANHVLFDVAGTTSITNSSTVNGTVVDQLAATASNGSTINGALISENNISISGTVNYEGFQAVTAPEMPTIMMAACGCLLVLGKIGWDRMRGKR